MFIYENLLYAYYLRCKLRMVMIALRYCFNSYWNLTIVALPVSNKIKCHNLWQGQDFYIYSCGVCSRISFTLLKLFKLVDKWFHLVRHQTLNDESFASISAGISIKQEPSRHNYYCSRFAQNLYVYSYRHFMQRDRRILFIFNKRESWKKIKKMQDNYVKIYFSKVFDFFSNILLTL